MHNIISRGQLVNLVARASFPDWLGSSSWCLSASEYGPYPHYIAHGMQGKAIDNGNPSYMIRVNKCKSRNHLKIRPSCNGLAHSCTYLSSLLVNNRCFMEFSSPLQSPYDGSRRLILSSMSLIPDIKGLHCQMASPSG